MKYRILHYGEEQLRKESEPIKVIDDEIIKLVKDMEETMKKAEGIGLAAPQIGKNIRLAIIDADDELLIMINPQILKKSGTQTGNEGCLSFPGLSESVKRANKIVVQAVDIDGSEYELEAEGLMARAIQHEMDHLDGVLFVDRISKARKLQIKNELEQIKLGQTASYKSKVA